jgi:hypothetical protein
VDPARLESISNLLTNTVFHHQQELELRERLGELGSSVFPMPASPGIVTWR